MVGLSLKLSQTNRWIKVFHQLSSKVFNLEFSFPAKQKYKRYISIYYSPLHLIISSICLLQITTEHSGRCQSLLESTSMGSHPLLMVDVKVYYSQRVWVHTPFANGRCQSLLESTSLGSHSLLMVDVKVYYSRRVWVHTLC